MSTWQRSTGGLLAAATGAFLVMLAGCAASSRALDCEAVRVEAVPDGDAIPATKQRFERGLLPLTALAGAPDSVFTLRERLERYGVQGVSIAVIDSGRIAWSGAYGVRKAGDPAPVTDTTLFQAGSISKSVAAATALRLVARGAIDLDEDVNRRLHSWHVPDQAITRERRVTLRHLLSHAAGFNVPGFPGYERGSRLPTLAQLLADVAPANTPPAEVEAVPGTEWRWEQLRRVTGRYRIELTDRRIDIAFTIAHDRLASSARPEYLRLCTRKRRRVSSHRTRVRHSASMPTV